MNTTRRISPRRYRLAPTLTALLAILGCQDDVTSPRGPETEAAEASLVQASNTWIARAQTPRALHGSAVGAAPNAAGDWFVHVFGGDNGDRSNFPSQRYNVETNTWGGGSGAVIPATDLNGVGKIGNRLFFTGGRQCCGEDGRVFNKTWAYEPSTDRLFQRANPPRATTSGVTGVIAGKLYVLAGFCSGQTADPGHCTVEGPVRQFWRYDPATNTWIVRRQPPHFHTSGAGAVINGKFYVVGDCCTEGSITALDVYDPVTNTWTTPTRLPFEQSRITGKQQFTAAVIQNKIFVLQSGSINHERMIKGYLYDPVTNSWNSRPVPVPPIFRQIVQVQLDGQPRLFLPGSPRSYLYKP